MVTLTLVPGTSCYAETDPAPRLVVRPLAPPAGRELTLSEAGLRGSVIAFPHPAAPLSESCAWLDAEAVRQMAAGEAVAAIRIVFLTQSAFPLATVLGHRDGTVLGKGGSAIPLGSQFGVLFEPATMGFDGERLLLDPATPTTAPHRLLRHLTLGATGPHASIRTLAIPLWGDRTGRLIAGGLLARTVEGQIGSSLQLYHDLGMVSRFVDVVTVKNPLKPPSDLFRATESALIHAGDRFETPGRFAAELDPHHLHDETRSFIRLLPAEEKGALQLAATTTAGHAVAVTAAGGEWNGDNAPKFVFTSHLREGSTSGGAGRVDILTLTGTYDIDAPVTESDRIDLAGFGLAPGFSPSEAMLPARAVTEAEAAAPLQVSFKLGPSRDRRIDPTVPEDAARPMLEAGASGYEDRTSWMQIRRGETGAMDLAAESPSAHTLVSRGGKTGVLAHVPMARRVGHGGVRESAASTPVGHLPILPPSGVLTTARKEAKRFDQGLLARERIKQTGFLFGAGGTEAGPSANATTPLGFEIETGVGGAPSRIVFARFETGNATGTFGLAGKDGKPLDSRVLDALVRNNLFLVANRIPTQSAPGLAELPEAVLDGGIGIAGWTFKVELAGSRRKATESDTAPDIEPVVIVKNHPDRSIETLVGDVASWSRRDLFVSGEERVQEALRRFVADAKSRASASRSQADKDRYQRLYGGILADPAWQGVLVIGAGIDLGGLPLQLKGLLAGIELDRLQATYVAIPMKRLPSGAERPLSRLDALVDYRSPPSEPPCLRDDDDPPERGEKSFGFDVERLVVEFARGEVLGFEANVRLAAKRLFHAVGRIETATRSLTGGNPVWSPAQTIDLAGRYERRRDGDRVVESYVFESGLLYRYLTVDDSKDGKDQKDGDPEALIRSAQLSRVAYETISTETAANGDQAVRSAFRIDGRLTFGTMPKVGLPDILDIDGVDFNDLRISTDFILDALKGLARDIMMSFRIGALGLDFKSAGRRPGGLGFWSSFPLNFKRLWLFDGRLDLAKLGYFSAQGFEPELTFRFGFEFDLDLGTLGALAAFKGLRLGVLFAIQDGGSFVKDGRPRFTLGFRFPEGDGSLDIGLQGILKLKARKYGILDTTYDDGQPGSRKSAKMLYGVGARLQVLGKDFPRDDGLTLALFVNPANWTTDKPTTGSVGWFIARKPESEDAKAIAPGIDLDMIMLGQRIDPMPDKAPRTTQEFVANLDQLFIPTSPAKPSFKGDVIDPVEAAERVVKVLSGGLIAFAPERNWSIGLSAWIANRVKIGIAMRDADIYGLRVGLHRNKTDGEPIFAVDILYRKLSDRLGVYSIEVAPPESLRQIDFGAVTIDLPTIGLEIFTDGGFTIDLGYPWQMDYARAFGVQLLPFIGSGGLYYRQVSGPGAKSIPQAKVSVDGGPPTVDSELLLYQPVVEAGLAFRVGLGKEIDKGIFKAGLSLTVFATLEGGFGILRKTEKFDAGRHMTKAADTFIAVRGTVGIIGEIYGYVDFGIVKAGVSVRVWVSTGFDFRTDHRTRLFIEAGVSVSVRVVIARIRIFGKRIEIAISFSFSTKVDYSTYIGSDRNLDFYAPSGATELGLIAMGSAEAMPVAPIAAFDWSASLAPQDWRASEDKLAFTLRLSPDVTLAPDGRAMRPEAVILLTGPAPVDARTDLDETPALLAAWAFAAAYGSPTRDRVVTTARLDELARALAQGPGVAAAATDRLAHLPDAGAIEALFGANIAARFVELPKSETADGEAPPREEGVLWPLPPGTTIRRERFAGASSFDDVELATKAVVDDDYRRKVNDELRRMMALIDPERAATESGEAAAAAASIVETIFVEHAVLVMRAAIVQLTGLADAMLRDGLPPGELRLGDLLDALTGPSAQEGQSGRPGPARDILRSATRLFLHGPRLPWPDLADSEPGLVPQGLAASGQHGLYRLGWMQVPLAGAGEDSAIVVGLRASYGASAKLVADGIDVDELKALGALGASPAGLGGRLGEVAHVRTERRRYHAGRVQPFADGGRLVMLDPQVLDSLAACRDDMDLALILRRLPAKAGDPLVALPDSYRGGDAPQIAAKPAIAVRLRLQPRKSGSGAPLDVFECLGMSEAERIRLDRLMDNSAATIVGVSLHAIDETALRRIDVDGQTTVAQTDASDEPKPFGAGASEMREIAPDESRFVATLPGVGAPAEQSVRDRVDFVEIIRRTAIVNRGGTLLGWHGASGAFARKDDEPFHALMVIALNEQAVALANAMLIDPGLGEVDRLEAVFAGGELTVAATSVAEPIAEAGVFPVRVVRDRPAAPAGSSAAIWEEMCERFSMLALGISDESGGVIVPVGATLATGPADPPDGQGTGGVLHYSAPIALAKLLGHASPYDCVGRRIRLHGVWRDVYGNDWSEPGFETDPIVVTYVDRLLPLTDLPGLAVAWWPASKPGRASIRFWLERRWAESLVPAGAAEADTPTPAHAADVGARLERAASAYRRALHQLNDGNVVLSILDGSAYSSPEPTLQRELAAGLATMLATIGELAKVSPDQPRCVIVKAMQEFIARASVDAIEIDARQGDGDFVELGLVIRVERTRFLPDDATQDMKAFEVPVRLGLRDTPAGAAPDFGGTLLDLQKVVWSGFSPDRMVATGLPGAPGRAEQAIWLIRRTVLPPEDHFRRIAAAGSAHAYATPPISRHLHNIDFKSEDPLESLTGAPPPTAYRSIDADVQASAALDAYEFILRPEMVDRFIRTPDGRAAMQDIVRAKAGDLATPGIASLLAARTIPVFAGGPGDKDRMTLLARRVLTDRLRGSLKGADAIDALVVFGEPEDGTRLENRGPQAYGRFTPAGDPPMKASPFVMTVGGKGQKHDLVIAVDANPNNQRDELPLLGRYRITHVQRLDRLDGGADATSRYRPTAWLALVPPETEEPEQHPGWVPDYAVPETMVPVIRRRYPVQPTIISEEAASRPWDGKRPIDATLRNWSTTRIWTAEAGSTDLMRLILRYNPSGRIDSVAAPAPPTAHDEAGWAEAFLRFSETVSPALRSVNATAAGAGDSRLAGFLAKACTRLWNDLGAPRAASSEAAPVNVLDEITIEERSEHARRSIETRRKPHDLVRHTRLKLAVLKDAGAVLGERPVPDPAWDNAPRTPGVLQMRRLEVEGLDILALRSVQTELTLVRNAEIHNRKVQQDFVYQVPTIASGAKKLPRIDVATAPIATTPASFAAHVASLIDAVLARPGGLANDGTYQTLLSELSLNLIVTYEPTLASGVDAAGDGLHVAGLSRADLSGPREAWLSEFVAEAQLWLDRAKPPSGGRFVFDLRLHDGAGVATVDADGGDRLLLRLRRGVLPSGLVV
ncbi:MAG: hypothetical protein K2Z25_05650 [Beijerinckiaceae bacterium]|nr:hypothetical protein [Beijerinckiaceae bacterium]